MLGHSRNSTPLLVYTCQDVYHGTLHLVFRKETGMLSGRLLQTMPHTCYSKLTGRFKCLGNSLELLLLVISSFSGLEVACWPLVPKYAGSHPAEAVGFLG